jgi:hypothetical protein
MDYHDPQGTNLIREWYRLQDDETRASFRFTLGEIVGTRDLNDSPSFVPCEREHLGLFRIKFEIAKPKKRQFRVAVFRCLNSNQIILVDGCQKSGRFTIPPKVFDKALDLEFGYYVDGKGTIYEHNF